MEKNKKIPGLSANILEIKQRGMAFLILTFIRNMPAKTLTF